MIGGVAGKTPDVTVDLRHQARRPRSDIAAASGGRRGGRGRERRAASPACGSGSGGGFGRDASRSASSALPDARNTSETATTHATPKSANAIALQRHRVAGESTMTAPAAKSRPTMPKTGARTTPTLRDNPAMSEPAWWQRGAIYQIYPRSFADANGDGVGDLAGITAHLDHLASLQVEAIWLLADLHRRRWPTSATTSPTTATSTRSSARSPTSTSWSPQCHARDIKLVLDWVPNHSSDQHPWFLESRSSRDNPKRDWYVWRDADGAAQRLGVGVQGRAGRRGRSTRPRGQYYLHSFMPEQPDLNWDNPEVVAAMHDTLRFWMDRGVDGLRLDAIAKIAKDPLLRDQAGAPERHDEDWESIHGFLRGIRKVIDEYDDRMIVGEVALQDLHRVVGYLESGDQLHLAHNFVFIDQDWGAEALRRLHRRLRAPGGGDARGRRGSWPTTTRAGPPAASTTTGSARSAPARSW